MSAFFRFGRRLRPSHYLGGSAVAFLLIFFYAAAFQALFSVQGEYGWNTLWQDGYIHHVLMFGFQQAFLSAFLSVLIGVLVARAFFYQRFFAKSFLLKCCSLTFVLPSLVVIFGLIGIYGASGWLSQAVKWLGLDWKPDFYGLSGILTAHLFFNIPLATRMFLQSLQTIPNQQRQLAAQLGIRGRRFVYLLEWPYLRQQLLPVFAMIFMLCFSSFTIVLTLGGGPQYTTLEVAVYQAIVFDFDLAKAALLALLQFMICSALFGLCALFAGTPDTHQHSREYWFAEQTKIVRMWQMALISLFFLFIALPLVNILFSALLSAELLQVWQSPQLWRAMGYSFSIAPLSALSALLMSAALLLLSRRLQWLQLSAAANLLMNSGMLILAIPTLVLAVGLFMLLQERDFSTYHLFFIVVLCNAFASMPFVIRVLALPMNTNMMYYEKLCQSLDIRGWRRLRLIEWHHLAGPVKYAFALAFSLSLGDFTAIALFGSHHFTSLPHLLYQQLGSYRGEQAAVTALILLLVCLSVFWIAERNKTQDD